VTIPRSSHLTKARVEVITSVERRRRWAAAEKERIVAASLEAGAVVSVLARETGIHPSQLYGWRRRAHGSIAAWTTLRWRERARGRLQSYGRTATYA